MDEIHVIKLQWQGATLNQGDNLKAGDKIMRLEREKRKLDNLKNSSAIVVFWVIGPGDVVFVVEEEYGGLPSGADSEKVFGDSVGW